MAHFVLTNCNIYFNEFDLTSDHNEIALNYSAEAIDNTSFGDTTRVRIGGLKVVVIDGHGWWDSVLGANSQYIPDNEYFSNIGVSDNIITLCPTGGADGEPGFFVRQVLATYTPVAGAVGEKAAFNIHAEGANPSLIKGTMLLGKATKTASASGTAYQLGAVGLTQSVYGVLHVFSASAGDTMDVIVQSDDGVGFATPTTRLTFSQVAGATEVAEWQSAAGAITDDWWRVNWTIAGDGSESFSFAVCIGIL